MAIRLGDDAPDFTAETTEGTIDFHDWKKDSWAVLFSHPKDFTPVCTTELGTVAKLKPEFDKRNVKVIGLSVDAVGNHAEWAKDIEETQGTELNFPLIADPDRKVADLYDMIHPNANDTLTVRSVFIIGPDDKVKLTLTYPASTGRNFDELLRVIDSLQLTAKHKVATPANWKDGDDVIIGWRRQRRGRQGAVPRRLEGPEAVPAHVPQPEVSCTVVAGSDPVGSATAVVEEPSPTHRVEHRAPPDRIDADVGRSALDVASSLAGRSMAACRRPGQRDRWPSPARRRWRPAIVVDLGRRRRSRRPVAASTSADGDADRRTRSR